LRKFFERQALTVSEITDTCPECAAEGRGRWGMPFPPFGANGSRQMSTITGTALFRGIALTTTDGGRVYFPKKTPDSEENFSTRPKNVRLTGFLYKFHKIRHLQRCVAHGNRSIAHYFEYFRIFTAFTA
jgi:hypothetical protein